MEDSERKNFLHSANHANYSIKTILNDYKDSEHYFEGYVFTKDEVVNVLRLFSTATCTRFSVQKACRSFGTDLTSAELQNVHGSDNSASDKSKNSKAKTKGNFYDGKLRCLWSSQREPNIKFDGTPFVVRGSKVMQCKCVTGPFRSSSGKVKCVNKDEPKAKKAKVEKKQRPDLQVHDCTARIRIKEIFRFPEYVIEKKSDESSKHFERVTKRLKLDELRDVCACTGRLPMVERRFYLLLPKSHVHNHPIGIERKVSLQSYIAKLQEEDPSASFYFQSRENGGNSQENMAVQSIEDELKKADNANTESVEADLFCGESFLFVHQTSWQRELLMHYGNELSVLNPMIETQCFCLPLYFVFVKTDLGYTCVATFIVQKEIEKNISSALDVLQEWNPAWQPKYWMTVLMHSGSEISALTKNFPASKVYLCPFFVEDAFQRWIRVGHYKLDSSEQDEVEAMLLRIMNAEDEPAILEAQRSLEKSDAWIKNQYLQNWFCDLWLPHIERWAYYYQRLDGYFKFVSSVNTHTSLAKMNIVHQSSNSNQERTLRGVIAHVVNSYLPLIYSRFMRHFLRHTSTYSLCLIKQTMPAYLDDRPHMFFKHCVDMLSKAERPCEISKIPGESPAFTVTHQNDDIVPPFDKTQGTWTVEFVSQDGMPHCSCDIWQQTRWPCNHFFILFLENVASWTDFPEGYLNSPFFMAFSFKKTYEMPKRVVQKQRRQPSIIKVKPKDQKPDNKPDFAVVDSDTTSLVESDPTDNVDEQEILNLNSNVVLEVVISDEVVFEEGYYDTGYVSGGEDSRQTGTVFIPLNANTDVQQNVGTIYAEDEQSISVEKVSDVAEVQKVIIVQSDTPDPLAAHNYSASCVPLKTLTDTDGGQVFLQYEMADGATMPCAIVLNDDAENNGAECQRIMVLQPEGSIIFPSESLVSHEVQTNSLEVQTCVNDRTVLLKCQVTESESVPCAMEVIDMIPLSAAETDND